VKTKIREGSKPVILMLSRSGQLNLQNRTIVEDTNFAEIGKAALDPLQTSKPANYNSGTSAMQQPALHCANGAGFSCSALHEDIYFQ
jgi:hypothetical protein